MRKKKMVLFIDGENIPAKESQKIFNEIKDIGELDYAKVYGIKKDLSTRAWSERAIENPILKDIRLCGGPGKNKVDHKIQKDVVREVLLNKNIEIVVIATSDHGYSNSIKELQAKGKKVIVIGSKKTAKSLVAACDKYIML